MITEKLKQEITALLHGAKEQNLWGGDDGPEGQLYPGTVAWEELQADILAVIDRFVPDEIEIHGIKVVVDPDIPPDEIHFRDEKTGELLGKVAGVTVDEDGKTLRAYAREELLDFAGGEKPTTQENT